MIDRDGPSSFHSLEHLLRSCARPPFALAMLPAPARALGSPAQAFGRTLFSIRVFTVSQASIAEFARWTRVFRRPAGSLDASPPSASGSTTEASVEPGESPAWSGVVDDAGGCVVVELARLLPPGA